MAVVSDQIFTWVEHFIGRQLSAHSHTQRAFGPGSLCGPYRPSEGVSAEEDSGGQHERQTWFTLVLATSGTGLGTAV